VPRSTTLLPFYHCFARSISATAEKSPWHQITAHWAITRCAVRCSCAFSSNAPEKAEEPWTRTEYLGKDLVFLLAYNALPLGLHSNDVVNNRIATEVGKIEEGKRRGSDAVIQAEVAATTRLPSTQSRPGAVSPHSEPGQPDLCRGHYSYAGRLHHRGYELLSARVGTQAIGRCLRMRNPEQRRKPEIGDPAIRSG
jgi:hypothetical protein